ncbi:hypothetical protein YQE_03228, partial [Dendroctonus ponderosae]
MLKSLNDKFFSPLTESNHEKFLAQFFTCPEKCKSCSASCVLSTGHKEDDEPHKCNTPCKLQHQYQNFVYLCKDRPLFGSFHSGQRVVDGVSVITDAVASVSSPPTKMLLDYMNDKIAPRYWRPNHEIKACFKCNVSFVSGQNRVVPSKHHCRSCGEGFCGSCSSKKCPVPHRGWKESERVCDACFDELEGRGQSLIANISEEQLSGEVTPRYIGERLVHAISAIKYVYDVPKNCIKEYVRPSYWTPDSKCINCVLCNNPFRAQLPLHHCRDCGKGVCDNCSTSRKPVPMKGWDSPTMTVSDDQNAYKQSTKIRRIMFFFIHTNNLRMDKLIARLDQIRNEEIRQKTSHRYKEAYRRTEMAMDTWIDKTKIDGQRD